MPRFDVAMAGTTMTPAPTRIAARSSNDRVERKQASATGVRTRIATPQLFAYGNGADGRTKASGAPHGCCTSANGGKKRSRT